MKGKEDNKRCWRLFLGLAISLMASCVAVEGERYDKENQCWIEPEAVDHEFGLFNASTGNATYAEGPDGDLWFFDSGPIPDCFTPVDLEAELGEARCKDL